MAVFRNGLSKNFVRTSDYIALNDRMTNDQGTEMEVELISRGPLYGRYYAGICL
jgi:hypothetical protein